MKWFVAEILVLNTASKSGSYVLHNNFVLIQADDPETAAVASGIRGRSYDDSFTNTDGETVTVRYLGLRNLHEIYDELENGAEILYEQFSLSSESEALEFVRPRGEFAVFRVTD